jgi:uncharacterized lipoprotein YddW (UPF0748 family)
VPFREVRGLWVVRTTLTDEARIARLVEEAARAGINTLVVQVRGRADAYYRSSLEPRAAALAARPVSFDPLEFLLTRAHARGIQVHAWIATHLVWGMGPLPTDPDHLVNTRPDLLSLPAPVAREVVGLSPFHPRWFDALHRWTLAQEGRLEGLYTDPAHPEVKERVVDVVEELATRYDIDGIHLDYVRYPSPEFGYNPVALSTFRRLVGPRATPGQAVELDGQARRDPLAWAVAFPQAFDDFRREQITRLVDRVRARLREVRPEMLLSAAVFADPVDAMQGRFQAWPEWLAQGLVDVVVPMAYTPDAERFRELTEAARRADGDGRRVWMGVGVYTAPFETAVRQVEMAREGGAAGIVLFSWDWMDEAPPPAGTLGWLQALAARAFVPRR